MPAASLLMMVLACGASKDGPAAPTPTETEHIEIPAAALPSADAGEAATVEEPDGTASAATDDCTPSQNIILTQKRSPLRGPEGVVQTLQVHDNGCWELTGAPESRSGCLSPENLATLQAALDAADITAPELDPGMARCMAMPTSEITVEAKGQTATWNAPCGPSNPSESLNALLTTLGSFTGQ